MSEHALLFALLWMPMYCAENYRRKNIVYHSKDGFVVAPECNGKYWSSDISLYPYMYNTGVSSESGIVHRIVVKDDSFPNDVPFYCEDPKEEYYAYGVLASQKVPPFSVDTGEKRPRRILIRFTEKRLPFVPGRTIWVSVYGPGLVPLDEFSDEEGRLPKERDLRVDDHKKGEYRVIVRVQYTGLWEGGREEATKFKVVEFPAAPQIQVHFDSGIHFCNEFCDIRMTAEGALPEEIVTDFEISVNLVRWSETFLYSTKKVSLDPGRFPKFVYTYRVDKEILDSAYDSMEFLFTPLLKEYRGKTTKKRMEKTAD